MSRNAEAKALEAVFLWKLKRKNLAASIRANKNLNEQTSNKMIHAILALVFLTSYFYRPVLCSKAIKLICDGKKSDHVTPYYSKLNILEFQDLYENEVVKIAFRFSRNNLLASLQHLFC